MRKRRGRISRQLTERLGLVLLLVDLWRKLPRQRRRQLLGLARKHGPRLARNAFEARRRRRR